MGEESSEEWLGTMAGLDDNVLLGCDVTRRPQSFIIPVLIRAWVFDNRLGRRYNADFGADVRISACPL
jgi:hypothetical protein